MAINFSKPATADTYATFVAGIQGNDVGLAQWLDSSNTTITGTPPTYAKRYNRTSSAVEEYNGSSWSPITFHGLNYNSGNVGLGTTTPVARMHVTGAGGTLSGSLSLSPTSTGGGASYLVMGNSDSGGAAGPNVIYAANRALVFGVGDSFAAASGGTFSEYMRLDSVGLGIGITAGAGYRLDIAGGRIRFNSSSGGANTEIVFASSGAGASGFGLGQGLGSQIFYLYDYFAGVERLRIDAIGNVGIGRSPGYRLDIQGPNQTIARIRGGTGTNEGAAYFVTVPGSDSSGGAFGNHAAIYGGTPTSDMAIYAAGFLSLGAGATERMRIDTSGHITPAANNAQTLGSTGLRWSTVNSVLGNYSGLVTAAAGITVGNTAIAGANVLDWYEEGSWTPIVEGATTPGTGTYSTQTGRFVRFGRLVFIYINASWTAHTGTGFTRITGLPYAAASTGRPLRAVPGTTGLAFDAWRGELTSGQTYIQLYGNSQNGGANANRSIVASDNWEITGFYEV